MSGQYTRIAEKTFTADEALSADRLVRVDSITPTTSSPAGVKYCQPHQRPHGIVKAATSSGDLVTVIMLRQYSSYRGVAGASITKGDKLFRGPDGKLYPYGCTASIGVALETVGSDGIVEWLFDPMTDRQDDDIFFVFDDFSDYTDGDEWTLTASDGGGATPTDARRSVVVLDASDGSVADNDETYLKSDLECFKFVNQKPIYFRAFVKLSEANTDNANIIVGLCDAVAADAIQDDGAGPKASYSGALFFKVDGGTVWQAEVSDGTDQDTDTNVGSFTSGSWHRLEFVWWPTAASTFNCYFYVDGVLGGTLVADGGTDGLSDYGSATEMEVILGVKNGDTNEESLYIDEVYVSQMR